MQVRKPSGLTHDRLASVVEDIQRTLWMDNGTQPPTWDVDNEWDSETIETVAAILTQAGLDPKTGGQDDE